MQYSAEGTVLGEVEIYFHRWCLNLSYMVSPLPFKCHQRFQFADDRVECQSKHYVLKYRGESGQI